ncbi:hypothetical protein BT93_K1247 [Corymbia citriodora subsp. variegata]|nr:hypothetical protein BT93_K1247 [Corymbia citriodora subsp. variegata]
MIDTIDDITEEILFQNFNKDCKLLDNLLNNVFQTEVGGKFMEQIEINHIEVSLENNQWHNLFDLFCLAQS